MISRILPRRSTVRPDNVVFVTPYDSRFVDAYREFIANVMSECAIPDIPDILDLSTVVGCMLMESIGDTSMTSGIMDCVYESVPEDGDIEDADRAIAAIYEFFSSMPFPECFDEVLEYFKENSDNVLLPFIIADEAGDAFVYHFSDTESE